MIKREELNLESIFKEMNLDNADNADDHIGKANIALKPEEVASLRVLKYGDTLVVNFLRSNFHDFPIGTEVTVYINGPDSIYKTELKAFVISSKKKLSKCMVELSLENPNIN